MTTYFENVFRLSHILRNSKQQDNNFSCWAGVYKVCREYTMSSERPHSIGSSGDESPTEVTYIPIRVLGKGAFGEATLYRRVEVSKTYNN